MIRKAHISDVKTIQALLKPFSERGEVLPRSLSEIYDNLRDYSVYCNGEQETIVGTCAIHVCWEDLAEIRSLAVTDGFAGQGIGKALINEGLSLLKDMGGQGCALVGDPNYYKRLGFKNHPDLIHEGIPQEVFLVLPFTEKIPKGIVVFHEGFKATD